MECVWYYRSIFYVFCHCIGLESIGCSRPVWQIARLYYIETSQWNSSIFNCNDYKLHWHSKPYIFLLSRNFLVWFIRPNCSLLPSLELLILYGLLPMLQIKYEYPFLVGNLSCRNFIYFGQNGYLDLLLRAISFYHWHVQEVQA